MSVVRIAFLGTPEFARFHLAGLLQDPHYSVVGVVTQPDRPSGRHLHLTPSPVKKLAQEKGIKVISPDNVRSQDVLDEIRSWKAEAAVVVAFGQILPQKFLDLFPLKVVNVHGSLLPRWRGAAPIQRAIEAGDEKTGVSLQVMMKKLDAGDVIGSYEIKIEPEWDANRLHDELMPLGSQLLQREFMDYLRGNLVATPQDESLVTYAHKIEKAEAKIDWQNKTATQVRNHVRAMKLGPGSVAKINGRGLKIISAEVATKASGKPGQVLTVDDEGFVVACKEGALRIVRVQPESKPHMSAHDFLLGNKIKAGDQFE